MSGIICTVIIIVELLRWYNDIIQIFLELVGGPLEGKYILEQFHCHWGPNNEEGSEHTIDGKKYAGEVSIILY